MFNSTHTFVGIVIARTGLDRWAPRAVLTATIAANLPDIDIITNLNNMPAYLEYHRGITHSLVGIPLLALAFSAVMYIFTRTFWRTYVVALAAMATHPILDYSNTYGLRPFLPFDGMWYYGDTIFIIDPIIDIVLLLGIIAGVVFSKARRAVSLAVILAVVVYVGFRISARNDAVALLDTYVEGMADFKRSAVLPRLLDTVTWEGVVETERDYSKLTIDTAQGVVAEVARLPKLPPTPVAEKAAVAESAVALLHFARFPITRVHESHLGYRVTFLDFRFYSEVNQTSFAAKVDLDHSMKITKESLGFNESVE
jgi:inner membrane protein